MRKVLGWMLAHLLLLAVCASAQTPRDELKQNEFAKMLDILQKTPKDDALRENIVRLAVELKPAPAVPEEARRELVVGNSAVEEATGADDYARAVKHYENALALAPWWGVAYLNLARAQELQFDYASAQRNLKLYMLTVASADDTRKAQDYLYALQAKEERADRTKADYDSKFGWLSGRWSVTRKLINPNGYTLVETDPVVTRTTDEGSRVLLKVAADTTQHDHRTGGDSTSSTRFENSFRVAYDSSDQLTMETFGADDRYTCPVEHGWNAVDFELGSSRQTITVSRPDLYGPPDCKPSGLSEVWVFERGP